MPLYTNYSTGSNPPANSDQFGNVYIAGAALQTTYSYGPTPETNWVAGIDTPIGGYTWYRYITGSEAKYSRCNSTNDANTSPPADGINVFPGSGNPDLTNINIGENVDSASLAELRRIKRGKIHLTQDNGADGLYQVTNTSLQIGGNNLKYTKCTVETIVSQSNTGFSTGGGSGSCNIGGLTDPRPEIRVPTEDSELLDWYNRTKGTSYTNALQVKDAIADDDDQLLEGEPIRDGLVLYLDPNNDNSYDGKGTTVYNVAPAATALNVTGVLDNSSMYVSPGGGDAAYFRVRSDSTVQRLEFENGSGAGYTIERHGDEDNTLMFFWWSDYNPNGQYGASQAFFGGQFTNYMALQLATGSSTTSYRPEAETNAAGGNHDYFARTNIEGTIFPTASWNSWTSVFSSSITASNWFNGFPGVGDDGNNNYALQEADVIHSFNKLGSTATGTGANARGGDIRMGVLLMYNRVLTEDEIRFNLNLFEQRYS